MFASEPFIPPPPANATPFDGWAPLYDRIHQGQPGDVAFYRRFAGARSRVLVVGCGTGRVAIPLAESRAKVVGLDASEPMLERCREKSRAALGEGRRFDVLRADMARFELGHSFDVAIVPYRTFMHLHRQEDQRSCLRNIETHLVPGGLCLMTTSTPSAQAIAARSPLTKTRLLGVEAGAATPLRHRVSASYDEGHQRIVEEHVIYEIQPDGAALEIAHLPLVRTWTSRREMLNLIALSGLEVCGIFSDFHGAPCAMPSGEFVWILRKN